MGYFRFGRIRLPDTSESAFTTAVCESRNESDKYTWDNAGGLKQLFMDKTLSEDNGSD